MMQALAPVSVVGAGNWLLSHDRIGPEVLRRLEGRHGPEVALLDIGCAGLDLLDHLHGQDLMLLLDACIQGGRPGEVRVLDADPDRVPESGSSVHQLGPLEVLAVARRLFPETLPRRVRLILVESEGLTPDDEARACEAVLAQVDQEIAAWRRLNHD